MKTINENELIKLEISVEKALYMVDSTIENYNLDSEKPMSKDEALGFALNRENIGISLNIIGDYLRMIKETLKEHE